MMWVLATIGAVVGGLFAAAIFSELFPLGAGAGFLLGLLIGLPFELRKLEKRVARLEAALAARQEAEPSAVTEASPRREIAEARPAQRGIREPLSPPATVEETASRSPAAESPPVSPPHPIEASTADTRAQGQRLLGWLRAFFTGENAVVRVGLLVLFVGVAMLYRYGVEQGWFHLPVAWRFVLVALAALAALLWGWRLRHRRRSYALLIQGGAVGLLYLTVYAATRLFALLPAGFAFALMLSLVLLAAALALLQNARALAAAGAVGGFLAPLLTVSEPGNPVLFFGYYAVLNVGILTIAWYRPWRELNLIGFYFTLVVSGLWAREAWQPAYLATTEPFLIFFFLLFSVIGVLHALRSPGALRGFVDGTLVFGTPLVCFGLQWLLLRERDELVAWSALVMAAYYVFLARAVWRRHAKTDAAFRPLAEALLAIAIAFLILVVPLALHGNWVSVTWALQGAALVWLGGRQARPLPILVGVGLQLVAGLLYLIDTPLFTDMPFGLFTMLRDALSTSVGVESGIGLRGGLIALAGLFSAWRLAGLHAEWSWTRGLHWLLVIWGLGWWLAAEGAELALWLTPAQRPAAWVAMVAISFAVLRWLGGRLAWPALREVHLALLPLLGLLYLLQETARITAHPLANGGWMAWPLAWGVWYHGLARGAGSLNARSLRVLQSLSLWLLLILLARELAWQVDTALRAPTLWGRLPWILVPALALWWLGPAGRPGGPVLAAPPGPQRDLALVPLAVLLGLWVPVSALGWEGRAEPLPYLPLLNPLELSELAVMLILFTWLWPRRARLGRWLWVGSGAMVFLWLDGLLARTTHFLFHVPFRFDALFASFVYQALLSVVWGLVALGLMVVASRRHLPVLWRTGLGLYGLTVAKLFLVDLAGRGTLERIISFLVVGALLVATGYFARMPSSKSEDEEASA